MTTTTQTSDALQTITINGREYEAKKIDGLCYMLTGKRGAVLGAIAARDRAGKVVSGRFVVTNLYGKNAPNAVLVETTEGLRVA